MDCVLEKVIFSECVDKMVGLICGFCMGECVLVVELLYGLLFLLGNDVVVVFVEYVG